MWTNHIMIHALASFLGSDHAPIAFNAPTFHTAGGKSCESLEMRLRRRGSGRGYFTEKATLWQFNRCMCSYWHTLLQRNSSHTKLNSDLLWCLIANTSNFLIQYFGYACQAIYICLHVSRLREHSDSLNKICVDVTIYMGVTLTLSCWVLGQQLVFLVSSQTTTVYSMHNETESICVHV